MTEQISDALGAYLEGGLSARLEAGGEMEGWYARIAPGQQAVVFALRMDELNRVESGVTERRWEERTVLDASLEEWLSRDTRHPGVGKLEWGRKVDIAIAIGITTR